MSLLKKIELVRTRRPAPIGKPPREQVRQNIGAGDLGNGAHLPEVSIVTGRVESGKLPSLSPKKEASKREKNNSIRTTGRLRKSLKLYDALANRDSRLEPVASRVTAKSLYAMYSSSTVVDLHRFLGVLMKKIIAATALIGSAISAQAADLPTKAPVYKALSCRFTTGSFLYWCERRCRLQPQLQHRSRLRLRATRSVSAGSVVLAAARSATTGSSANFLGFGNLVARRRSRHSGIGHQR